MLVTRLRARVFSVRNGGFRHRQAVTLRAARGAGASQLHPSPQNSAKTRWAACSSYCTHGDGSAAYCCGWLQGWLWLVTNHLVMPEGGDLLLLKWQSTVARL